MKWFNITKQPDSRSQPEHQAGIHHYLRQNGENKKRIHLRIEEDGNAVMLVNASRIYHFNPSAALMASLTLEEKDETEAIKSITHAFAVGKSQAAQDYRTFLESFLPLIDPGSEACPICDLNIETNMPFSNKPSAPYRMDLAITYRCNNDCVHCYNQKERARLELNTSQWKDVLDKVWNTSIPHVVFTGGEPTLRADLPDLIAYAEKLGLITGINTNGRRLKDVDYLNSLVSAGLDHAQITLESADEKTHDAIVAAQGAWKDTTAGLRNTLNTKLFVMTNSTLLRDNSSGLEELLEFTAKMGVPTVGLNGLIRSGRGRKVDCGLDPSELTALLKVANRITNKNKQRLIWYTPTQYCHFDPLALELGVKGCSAALYNMCVEPDGEVLPCQSYYVSLGNILSTSWESIWNHDLAVSIRERHYAPQECRDCSVFSSCGAGCPLEIEDNLEVLPHRMLAA